MINALTIDLEPWYVSEFLTEYLPEDREDQIEASLKPILDLLDRYNKKATFFVLGIVAEKHPELVYEIHKKGHEIASHAYSHQTLYKLGEAAFTEEIKKSIRLLESITGEKPIGFRAPSFSVNNSTKWVFRVLKENGFKYDSSIFPIKTMLYGVPNAPLFPYKPSMDNIAQHDPDGDIVEFPLAVLRFVKNVPVAGGFYLRLLPLRFITFALRRVSKLRMATVYFHPWETYPMTPRLRDAPLFSRFVTYFGINSALNKVEALLKQFDFQPIREFLEKA